MYASVLLMALSQNAPAWNDDYRQALERAAAAQKPLAVVINSGKKGWNGLSSDGQLDADARRVLAQNYVCLYVDASSADGRELAASFKATRLPTVVLSDTSRTYVAHRHSGTLENGRLAQVLQRHTKEPKPAESQPVIHTTNYQPAAQPAPTRVYFGRSCST